MTDTINLERLQHFIPFDGLSSSHMEELRGQIEVLQLPAARPLFKRGESSEQAYFLVEGELDLVDGDFQVTRFNADDDENYLALDNYPQHTISAVTTAPTVIYTLARDKLDLLMTWIQAAESMLGDSKEEGARDWMDSLLSSGLFSQVPPQKIQSLFTRFEEREVQLGDVVIREHEPGEELFVIKRGRAMVIRGEGKRMEVLAPLSAGSFFGEDALISDSPRNASVVMSSDGVLMCLSKESFQQILEQSVIRALSEAELEALQEEQDRSAVLIDVRLASEFKHNRLPGARNIPLSELRKQLRSLEKDFIYGVVCDGGRRSALGAYLLTEAGYDAYVLTRATTAAETPDTEAAAGE